MACKPMFPKEKNENWKKSKMTDEEFKTWLKESIEEDKELLISPGKE